VILMKGATSIFGVGCDLMEHGGSRRLTACSIPFCPAGPPCLFLFDKFDKAD
jgi:hypothetical protein